MPWPLVPPDADFPSPTRRDPDSDWFATRIESSGLVPFKEQALLRFSVGGKDAAAWFPVQRSLGEHRYAGVVISTASTDKLEAEWLANGGRSRSYPLSIKTVDQQDARITGTKVTASTSAKIALAVEVQGATSGAHAVLAPFVDKMPVVSTHDAYQDLGAWARLSGGKATVIVRRHPDIKTYALFVALGVPDKIHPVSGVKLIEA